jgi:DNA-binding NarL/FixJ family response regulator
MADVDVKSLLKAGVSGCIFREIARDEAATALKTAIKGGIYLSELVLRAAIDLLSRYVRDEDATDAGLAACFDPESLKLLSLGEWRTVTLLGQGLTNREIAESLHRDEGTVRNYVRAINRKTGLNGRVQIALMARRYALSR